MVSIRNLFRSRRPVPSRNITITCRSEMINQEDLFRYTNGHFLINEERQLQQRYVKFSINELCDIAASAGQSKSPVLAIDKMEGGFCKALLMKKADGTELIAKIPSKRAGPPRYLTESEVATLQYVQEHTSIPVPKVLGWNSDPSNNVGSEYIIMEKADGVQLYKRWGKMNGTSKLSVIEQLVELESQLASINFPMFGSLYRRDSVRNRKNFHPLSMEIDPSQSYCIGPSADRLWYSQIKTPSNIKNGPWLSVSEYGNGLVQREISRILAKEKREERPYGCRGSKEEIEDLVKATMVLNSLDSRHKRLHSLSKPILWHTDLHLGNIYVSEDDPPHITSIIDWQSISVGPLFLQVTWPEFLKPTDEYMCGTVRPLLPENFDQLDEAEKELKIATRDNALLTKTYELQSFSFNDSIVYQSLNLPPVFREIFIRCGESALEGTTGLRACLVELSQSWSALGFDDECPISFTENEILEIEQEFEKYQEWHGVQQFAREYLETDCDGWISPEFNFSEFQQRNKSGFEKYINEMSKRMSSHDARRMWPFLENV
ncbi:hypothetical protein LOZ65_001991 [Ophidiomyces ophidiicola]|nr:hypothetical protein LOZ65_001991 [Ophidiomyces ophidiicola]